jgi:uncharacterized protein YcaQ
MSNLELNARTELADELESACKKFIERSRDTSHWSELKKAREELESLLWVNKEAIVSYLRRSA